MNTTYVGPTRRIAALSSLIREGLYPIDEREIAEAIFARSVLRDRVPAVGLRGDQREPEVVRSFRATRQAPSFRLVTGRARR